MLAPHRIEPNTQRNTLGVIVCQNLLFLLLLLLGALAES